MTYAHFLQRVSQFGLGQVSRLTCDGGYDVARVGFPKQAVFPYAFKSFPIILDNGLETELDDEIIDALLRKLCPDKTRRDIDLIV
jgi:hypothetical protein